MSKVSTTNLFPNVRSPNSVADWGIIYNLDVKVHHNDPKIEQGRRSELPTYD